MRLSPRASPELHRTPDSSRSTRARGCVANPQRLRHVPKQQQLCFVAAPEEKKISEVKADEKQTGKLCQFCSNEGGTEEKGIPKERLVLATDSEVTSDIKKKLISWGKGAAMGLGPRFA